MTFAFTQLSSSRQETATDHYRKSRIFHLLLLCWHYGVCQSVAMSLSLQSTCWKPDRHLKEKLILGMGFVCLTDSVASVILKEGSVRVRGVELGVEEVIRERGPMTTFSVYVIHHFHKLKHPLGWCLLCNQQINTPTEQLLKSMRLASESYILETPWIKTVTKNCLWITQYFASEEFQTYELIFLYFWYKWIWALFSFTVCT